MNKLAKRLISGAVTGALVLSSLMVPALAENAGNMSKTQWKFDMGDAAQTQAGYIAVPADTNYVYNVAADDGFQYGFLGLDDDGWRTDRRWDGFEMVKGQKIELENGAKSALTDQTDDYVKALPMEKQEGDVSNSQTPIRFAMKVVPNTYYEVSVTLVNTSETDTASATLFSEKRHPIAIDEVIPAGGEKTYTFSVNVQNVYSKTTGVYNDELLNIVALGDNVGMASVEVEKKDNGKTLWVLGDSTVCDQTAPLPYFPLQNYAGVGQALSHYLNQGLAVSNHGEGGLETNSSKSHFNNFRDRIQAGDIVFFEFGHNHKETNGEQNYYNNIPYYYDYVKSKGAKFVVVGPIDRHNSGQYDSSTNTWSSTLNKFSAKGKQFVDEKITAGADDIAFIDLNAPSLAWYTEICADLGTSEKSTDYYFRAMRGEGVDGTHPNDAGIDNFAYMFFKGVIEKAADAGTSAAEKAVLDDILTHARLNEDKTDLEVQPYTVTKAFADAGAAPNNPAYPVPIPSEVMPLAIKNVVLDENNEVQKLQVMKQANFATYARGIVAVYDENGLLKGVRLAKEQIDNTVGAKQTVTFNSGLSYDESAGENMRVFAWGFEDKPEENYPLTMNAFTGDYVPSDILEDLITNDIGGNVEAFDYYGVLEDGAIVPYGDWKAEGSANGRKYALGFDNKDTEQEKTYVHLETSGKGSNSDGSPKNGSYYFYKSFAKEPQFAEDGKTPILDSSKNQVYEAYTKDGGVRVKFKIRVNETSKGNVNIKKWGGSVTKSTEGFSILGFQGSAATTHGVSAGTLNVNEWNDVEYILDIDRAQASLSINGGEPTTVTVEGYDTMNTEITPSQLDIISFELGTDQKTYSCDITDLMVSKIKTDTLPNKKLTIDITKAAEKELGSVIAADAEGNTVEIVNGTITAPLNTILTLTATPADTDHIFDNWTVGENVFSAEESITFRVRDDMIIGANFIEIKPLDELADFTVNGDKALIKAPSEGTQTAFFTISDAKSAGGQLVKADAANDFTYEVSEIDGTPVEGAVAGVTFDKNVMTVDSTFEIGENEEKVLTIKATANRVEKTCTLTVYSYGFYETVAGGILSSRYDSDVWETKGDIQGDYAITFPGANQTNTLTLPEKVTLDTDTTITYKNGANSEGGKIATCGQARTIRFVDANGKNIFTKDLVYSWTSLYIGDIKDGKNSVGTAIDLSAWTDIEIVIDKTAGTATLTVGGQTGQLQLAEGAADIAAIQLISADSVPGPEARPLYLKDIKIVQTTLAAPVAE